MVGEPRHPGLEAAGLIARRARAEEARERHQDQEAEQRKPPQQHQQSEVTINRGVAPVAPALGRKQALERPHDAGDQEQLQASDQHGLGNLARVARRLRNIQGVDYRHDDMGGNAVDGLTPELTEPMKDRAHT